MKGQRLVNSQGTGNDVAKGWGMGVVLIVVVSNTALRVILVLAVNDS